LLSVTPKASLPCHSKESLPMNDADRLVDRLTALALVPALITTSPLLLSRVRPAWSAAQPVLVEVSRSGLAGVPAAAFLLVLAGLAGTRILTASGRAGRAARWPQALTMMPLAALAGVLAWSARPVSAMPSAASALGFALGAGAASR
jgi:hypothetical protein